MVPQLLGGYALLFGGNNVKRHHRHITCSWSSIHSSRPTVSGRTISSCPPHWMATPVFLYVAHHTGVAGVVAAVGGQVEGDRKSLLPRCQIAAVKALLASAVLNLILPDGPRLFGTSTHTVRAKKAAAGAKTQRVRQIVGGIATLEWKLFGGLPTFYLFGVSSPARGLHDSAAC